MVEKNEHSGSGRARSGSYRSIVFLTLVLLVLGVIAYLGAQFWLYQPQPMNAPRAEGAASARSGQQKDMGPTVDLSEFLVNIISEDNSHYLRASMTIELSNPAAQEELIRRMPQVRDAILLLISNKTFEELYDLQGKMQLKAEIRLAVDELISTGEVTSVYLTDFIVQ